MAVSKGDGLRDSQVALETLETSSETLETVDVLYIETDQAGSADRDEQRIARVSSRLILFTFLNPCAIVFDRCVVAAWTVANGRSVTGEWLLSAAVSISIACFMLACCVVGVKTRDRNICGCFAFLTFFFFLYLLLCLISYIFITVAVGQLIKNGPQTYLIWTFFVNIFLFGLRCKTWVYAILLIYMLHPINDDYNNNDTPPPSQLPPSRLAEEVELV